MTKSSEFWRLTVLTAVESHGIELTEEQCASVVQSIRRDVMYRFPIVATIETQQEEIDRLKEAVRKLKNAHP